MSIDESGAPVLQLSLLQLTHVEFEARCVLVTLTN
jgi:hypothetical protein